MRRRKSHPTALRLAASLRQPLLLAALLFAAHLLAPALAGEPPQGVRAEPVGAPGLPRMSEGVVFDRDGNLYVSEPLAGKIYRMTPGGGVSVWARVRQPNGHKILPDGTHVVCDQAGRAVRLIDARGRITNSITRDEGGRRLREPNDVTPGGGTGGFYFTEPGEWREGNTSGRVHYVDARGRIV